MLSPSVFDRLITAISEQKSIPDNAQRMREAVAQVLAMLRSKSALYADLDNEFWGAVFASLRDLRNALTETRGKLGVNGPRSVLALLDLMIESVREYLGKHEARYRGFMESELQNLKPTRRELQWPELPSAASDLLLLREILIASIEPLNVYTEEGQAVNWEAKEFQIRQIELRNAKLRASTLATPKLVTRTDVPSLLDALQDERDWLRSAAADTLAGCKDPAIISTLIESLHNEDERVRNRAAEALRRIGAPAPATLMQVYQNSIVDLRFRFVMALGVLRTPEVLTTLVEALDDSDTRVRIVAINSMQTVGFLSGWPLLIPVVPDLIKALANPIDYVCRVSAEMLGRIEDPRAVTALIQALQAERFIVREGAAGGLAFKGHEALPSLASALKDNNTDVRVAAIQSIYSVGYSFGWSGLTSVVPALIETLSSDPIQNMRVRVIEILNNVRDRRAIPELIKTVQTGNEELRASAAFALGNSLAAFTLGKDEGNEVSALLINATKDEAERVRFRAVQAIGMIGDRNARPALIEALKDQSEDVRRAAKDALGSCG
jgi:HEAT repeat protein